MVATINNVIFSSVLALGALFLLVPTVSCNAKLLEKCGINTIYQLGDSTSDTGNLIRENPQAGCSRLPYGQYFFKNATGRCSDGLLIIDFFTKSAGVPFLEAYLNPNPHTRYNGLNFAVAGATALPAHVLAERNIPSPVTNSSLSKQLDWMFTYFNKTVCNNTGYLKRVNQTLFVVGEIGGNDYTYALFSGKALEEVTALVRDVVQAIKEAIKRIIGYGARRIVAPGHFPIGCLPIYLTQFQTNDSSAYDEFHCLKELNNLAIYHNQHLQQALIELIKEHPNVTIAYGDYYKAYMWTLQNAHSLGFDATMVQKACCGIGGEYDFTLTKMCGTPGVPVCGNPFERISWDGIHLTHKAYDQMASWVIRDILPKFQCSIA
ncbi:GDSL esterase/lipase At5g03980-like [Pistacia vera]|uniref:GDSL esterase/lipase At5g03980-like n=1 Tax=Pistacia vera TaxID=55513 RepID=UPI00126392B1|nr:GDSL esterase/lipase At5g03980-like [Pistacia vera]